MRDFVVYDALDATLKPAYAQFGLAKMANMSQESFAGLCKLVRVHNRACDELLKLERQ
jgi:hypothetical protein